MAKLQQFALRTKVDSMTAIEYSVECSEEQETETIRKEITAVIDSLKKKLSAAEQQVDGNESKNFCQELSSMLSKLDELITRLAEVCNKKMTHLEERDKTQQDEISSLRERVKILEGSEQKLLLGQLAFEVDKAVVDKVFKDSDCGTGTAEEHYINYIKDMEKAIKGEHPYVSVFQEHQRECIRQKWIELQDRLGWKERHYRGLKNLKRLRLREAHPQFSTEKMKDAIKEASRSEQEKKLCQEFMKMLEDIKLL